MTTVAAVDQGPLRTDRTIAKTLVHRTALEEVFLTDFRSDVDDGFVATARLPRAHPYYNDHTNHPTTHDPLAVFECVRQMLLCALHVHHGAAPDMRSVTATCELTVVDPHALAIDGYDLDLIGSVRSHKERDGVTTRVLHEVDVRLAGRHIATIAVDTAQKDSARYERLRMANRDTMPPLSSDLFDVEPASRVAPYLVGRQHQDNVVLLTPSVVGTEVRARLRVPVSNPGMFDHPHDHVPGPVLMEAARQLGTFAVGELFGQASSKTVLAALTANYTRFAELDSTILLVAKAGDQLADPMTVRFVQDGETVADMTLTMASTVRPRPVA